MSWFLLFALTGFAAGAALGVTLRARPEGRAETGVLFTLVFYALICGPIFALGYTNLLRPGTLAGLSLLTSTTAFLVSARGRSVLAHVREVRHAVLALARLPRDAFARAIAERSVGALGLACAAVAIFFSAWLTYLAPSESWDGFFYHEPIIGYAIQNQGFRMVSLPQNMVVQATNGYPRLCEAFALWFVIFTDKSLIEIGNTLAAPGLMLGVYLLGRRYSNDVGALVGWSSAVLLVPVMITQLRTSMIDVEVTFFLVAAIHFATRPTVRIRDAIAATLAMALIAGSKGMALTWVPPLALVAYGRLFVAHRRDRLRAVIAVAALGSVSIAAVAALTFARNYLAFGNPVWPVSYTNAALHIHWRGLATLEEVSPDLPLRELIARKYGRPSGDMGDLIARDYGYGVPWVVVPLAALAFVSALFVAIRGRLRGQREAKAESVLLLAALGAAFLKATPSLNAARYNMHVVAIMMAIIVWALARMRHGPRLHEGAVALTLVMTIVPMFWTGWSFGTSAKGLVALHRASAAERAVMHAMSFQMPPDVARARERDLGAGDLVLYSFETSFPGVLWNHAMSNRVEYVESRALLAEAERRHAKWVVVGVRSSTRAALEGKSAEWELVGTAVEQDRTLAFRRRSR